MRSACWGHVVSYINERKINEILLRKEMVKTLHEYCPRETTVDFYRMVLTRLDVLRYKSPGKYKKIKDVPKNLTSTKARDLAFNEPRWKIWFIPLDELANSERKKK